jgi:hypothetical protein
MEYHDMDGVQGYIDEEGNFVHVDHDMMGSDGDMDDHSYGHEGSPGYGDVSNSVFCSLYLT